MFDHELGIYHEHPDWFVPLFQELERRTVPYRRIAARGHRYDPDETPAHAVVFNRMSPSAHLRIGPREIFHTTHYLDYLERHGVRVINGSAAWRTETSKATQLALMRSLGIAHPDTRVLADPAEAPAAAAEIGYPVVVKPNVGGSGAGVGRFDAPEALEAAIADGALDPGVDHTLLVQEYIPPAGDRIVRVEVLDGRFLYAIRIYTTGDSFNLCPADVCRSVDGQELARSACPADAPRNGLRVEGYEPAPGIVTRVERLLRAGGIEVGGVEYMIDDRTGRPVFYDVNALSNFVADAPRVVGFDPFASLAEWLEGEMRRVAPSSVPALAGPGASERGVLP